MTHRLRLLTVLWGRLNLLTMQPATTAATARAATMTTATVTPTAIPTVLFWLDGAVVVLEGVLVGGVTSGPVLAAAVQAENHKICVQRPGAC